MIRKFSSLVFCAGVASVLAGSMLDVGDSVALDMNPDMESVAPIDATLPPESVADIEKTLPAGSVADIESTLPAESVAGIEEALPPESVAEIEEALAAESVAARAAGTTKQIRVHLIVAANSDGSQAIPLNIDNFYETVRNLDKVYAPHLTFAFDPQTDVTQVKDTLLNQDNQITGTYPNCVAVSTRPTQNAYAAKYPGKLVVLANQGGRMVKDDTAKKCYLKPRTFAFSGTGEKMVFMNSTSSPLQKLAHEMGHYFSMIHPHYEGGAVNKDDVAKVIKAYVAKGYPKASGLAPFDGDRDAATPHDPGPPAFRSIAGVDDNCSATSAKLTVNFPDGIPYTYTFAPDMNNVMSYYDKTGCNPDWFPVVVPSQATRLLGSLSVNRAQLVKPRILHTAILEKGDHGTTSLTGYARTDLINKLNAQQTAGRHLARLDAFDRGDGLTRYDAAFEKGSTSQSWLLGATDLNAFAARFDKEVAAGRHMVSLQAYRESGVVKYDGVWEKGQRNVTRALRWARTDLVNRQGREIQDNRHLVFVRAFDATGTGVMRYLAVWEAGGTLGQTSLFGAPIGDFAARNKAELAAGRHMVHVQGYRESDGVIRFDGVWEDGARDQTLAVGWALKDFIARYDREINAGRQLTLLQVYDGAGGVLRYNAVFEAGTTEQARILVETQQPFVERLNKLLANGFYVRYLDGIVGL